MFNFSALGRLLIVLGVFLLIAGGLILLLSRLGVSRMPGDIVIQRPNLVVYIPIVSALLLSLLLTLILNLIFWRWR